MKIRSILTLLFVFGITLPIVAQNQTVVFKVRKPKPEPVIITETNKYTIVIASRTEPKLFVAVEENATFRGGDLESFRGWVMEQIKYPDEAAEKGIEGKVILSFVVNKTGTVETVKVLRPINPLLDAEAIRIVKSSPKWVPGKHNGKIIDQLFYIPVSFKLTR